jgi:hypothetical protein
MSKQRFIQICSLLSFIPRLNPYLTGLNVSDGQYSHIGVENNLRYILELESTFFQKFESEICLKLSLNINGLPSCKSSTSQFWPILMSIDMNESTINKPFIVRIFHGLKKADTLNFLDTFIKELECLQSSGIFINNKKVIPIVSKIICDAPTKSFVLCVKGHTGYSGCTKCIQEGEFLNGRMTFPEIESTLHKDKSFQEKLDENYH